jgi:hypothetical protein
VAPDKPLVLPPKSAFRSHAVPIQSLSVEGRRLSVSRRSLPGADGESTSGDGASPSGDEASRELAASLRTGTEPLRQQTEAPPSLGGASRELTESQRKETEPLRWVTERLVACRAPLSRCGASPSGAGDPPYSDGASPERTALHWQETTCLRPATERLREQVSQRLDSPPTFQRLSEASIRSAKRTTGQRSVQRAVGTFHGPAKEKTSCRSFGGPAKVPTSHWNLQTGQRRRNCLGEASNVPAKRRRLSEAYDEASEA